MAANNLVTVLITNSASAVTKQAQLPTNVPIRHLTQALVIKLSLPTNFQYGFIHKHTNKRLLPTDTLTSAGVKDGDTLRLISDRIF